MGSHDALPPEERDVQTYLLVAIANRQVYEGIPEGKGKESLTIDEKFHKRAARKFKLAKDFRALLREVSIECVVNNYGHCRTCSPTDARLFSTDPGKDLRLSDPCTPTIVTEVAVHEIKMSDGRLYYYASDKGSPLGWKFYEWREDLEGYAPIDESEPIVIKLLRKVSSDDILS